MDLAGSNAASSSMQSNVSGRLLLPTVDVRAASSAICSVIAGVLLAFPLEKVILRRDGLLRRGLSEAQYSTLWSGLSNIWSKEGGIRGFYRGAPVQISRAMTTTAPLLIMDEALRSNTQWFRDSFGVPMHEASAGAAAGFASGIMHYPFDSTRLLIQTDAAVGRHRSRWVPQMLKVWQEAGLRRIFRGCAPSVAASTVRAGVLFSTSHLVAMEITQNSELGPLVSVGVGTAAATVLAVFCAQAVVSMAHRRQAAQLLRHAPMGAAAAVPPTVMSLTLFEAAKHTVLLPT